MEKTCGATHGSVICDLKQNDDSSFPIKMKHSAAHSDDPRLLAQQMQHEARGNLQEHSNA